MKKLLVLVFVSISSFMMGQFAVNADFVLKTSNSKLLLGPSATYHFEVNYGLYGGANLGIRFLTSGGYMQIPFMLSGRYLLCKWYGRRILSGSKAWWNFY